MRAGARGGEWLHARHLRVGARAGATTLFAYYLPWREVWHQAYGWKGRERTKAAWAWRTREEERLVSLHAIFAGLIMFAAGLAWVFLARALGGEAGITILLGSGVGFCGALLLLVCWLVAKSGKRTGE